MWTSSAEILDRVKDLAGYKTLRKWQKECLLRIFKELDIDRPRPLLIRLPTGYGKTLLGIAPFIREAMESRWSALSWLCYVLPIRALCNSLAEEKLIDIVKRLGSYRVNVFHGEAEVPGELFSDVAITTFDTFLLSYARKTIAGHHLERPAGFLSTSLVVFDEAHMIADEYLYSYTLLRAVADSLVSFGVPMIFITATMPRRIEEFLEDKIGEFTKIPEEAGRFDEKPQSYRGVLDKEGVELRLNGEDWLNEILMGKKIKYRNSRILIIVNTVERAAGVYKEIKKRVDKSVKTILLHSRIIKKDRVLRERLAYKLMRSQEKCGECRKPIENLPIVLSEEDGLRVYHEYCSKGRGELVEDVIIIATQVIEAGLDISADILITELAPADSLVQRCGRVARFPGEVGRAFIVEPKSQSPYTKELLESTKNALKTRKPELEETLMDMRNYQDFIDDAYKDFRPAKYNKGIEDVERYLLGEGLATFTVDWRMIERIKTRPESQITLFVPSNELKIFKARWRVEQGVKLSLNLLKSKILKLNEIIKMLENMSDERIELLVPRDVVREKTFTISLEYIRRRTCPNIMCVNDNLAIRLQPVKVREVDTGPMEFYILRPEKLKVVKEKGRKILRGVYEGIYMANPDFYNSEIGAVKLYE